MKKVLTIFLIFMLSIITLACAGNTTNKNNNKEVIEVDGYIADFIKSYDSSAELSKEKLKMF